MSQLTLLQITDAICGELGLVQPSTVVSATDLQTVQLYNIINRSGDAIRRAHQWTALQNLFTLNVGAPLVTTGNVTNGSAIITNIPTTAAITAGIFTVAGSSIPQAARVLTVDSGTQVTMNIVATGAGTAESLTFGQDTYPGPTDYDFSINRTSWDRTNRWELLGPASPQTDEWHQSGIVTTGPRRFFRWVGDVQPTGTGTFYNYRLWPPPQTVGTPFQIAWEYISNYWVKSSTGTAKASFTVDTDVPVLDSQAIILDSKWRFLQAKGFPTAASMQTEALDYIQQLIGRDGGAPTLNMSGKAYPYLLGPWNVQDGYFPGNDGYP